MDYMGIQLSMDYSGTRVFSLPGTHGFSLPGIHGFDLPGIRGFNFHIEK